LWILADPPWHIDAVGGRSHHQSQQEITADLPAATQFLSPRLFMNTGATAAAVAYDCAGLYLETDFRSEGINGSLRRRSTS
jgi:hypothetical protein